MRTMKKTAPKHVSTIVRKNRTARARRQKARNLFFERCEERIVLAANLFLQGTAFIDINGNNKLDYQTGSSDQYKIGATIQLFRDTTLIGEATTGADGRYLFDDSH